MSKFTAEDYLSLDTLRQDVIGTLSGPERQSRYKQGKKDGKSFAWFTISINDVWSAKAKDGGQITSYEKIGYHAGSVEFLEGVFDSGCTVYIYRKNGDHTQKYELDWFEQTVTLVSET